MSGIPVEIYPSGHSSESSSSGTNEPPARMALDIPHPPPLPHHIVPISHTPHIPSSPLSPKDEKIIEEHKKGNPKLPLNPIEKNYADFLKKSDPEKFAKQDFKGKIKVPKVPKSKEFLEKQEKIKEGLKHRMEKPEDKFVSHLPKGFHDTPSPPPVPSSLTGHLLPGSVPNVHLTPGGSSGGKQSKKLTPEESESMDRKTVKLGEAHKMVDESTQIKDKDKQDWHDITDQLFGNEKPKTKEEKLKWFTDRGIGVQYPPTEIHHYTQGAGVNSLPDYGHHISTTRSIGVPSSSGVNIKIKNIANTGTINSKKPKKKRVKKTKKTPVKK